MPRVDDFKNFQTEGAATINIIIPAGKTATVRYNKSLFIKRSLSRPLECRKMNLRRDVLFFMAHPRYDRRFHGSASIENVCGSCTHRCESLTYCNCNELFTFLLEKFILVFLFFFFQIYSCPQSRGSWIIFSFRGCRLLFSFHSDRYFDTFL